MQTWYTREGLVAVESPERGSLLHDLETGEDHELSPERAEAARALLLGLRGEAAAAAVERLEGSFAETRDEPFDRVLRDRLAALDEGFAWSTPASLRPLVRLAELAHSLSRHLRLDLDQLPVLPETAARRAALLRRLAGPGARVALVGDDDLVSILAAALGLRPTVLDLDPELKTLLEVARDRLGLDIDVRSLDLRQPLDDDLRGRFDAFCTDPETSRECVGLFVSRGVALVRPGGVGLVACAEEFGGLVDEVIERCDLVRLDVQRRAGNYRDGAARLAPYRSDLHVVGVTSDAVPVVAPDATFYGQLFPFGLDGGDHLLATLEECRPEALEGDDIPRLLATILGLDPDDAEFEDSRPMPLRVVTVQTPRSRAQATVRPGGTTVDLDITPAPSSEEEALFLTQRICRALGAPDGSFRTLRRLG